MVGGIGWIRKCFVPTVIATRTPRFHSAGHRLDHTAGSIRRHRRACWVFKELSPYGHPSGDQSTDVARWNHERVRDGEADGINNRRLRVHDEGRGLVPQDQ